MTVTYSKRKKEESFLAIKPNKSRVVVFDSQEESSKPVAKAMHELQEAGETSRFIDEMEYLLEGLNAQSALAIRRASAKELAMKCTNAAFATKIRALGYTIKIISCFLEDVDELHSDLIVSLGFLLSLLFQQNRKLELGNLSEKYFNFLVSLIFSQNAIDANCKIVKMFETQNLIDAVETVTFRWIGVNLLNKFAVCFENDIEIPLATLTNIILHVQENMVYSREVCKYLNILLFITDKFKNEKSWKFGFDFVHQLIRLDEDQITVTKILVNISGLPCRVDAFENVELIELALKKTIKLLEKVESKIDLVLLKLGFLINLVEHSSQIRQIISQLELENQFLDKLSAVFLKLQEQEEKIELRIVAAYLGLFLGCLSTENTTNLDMVISKISPKILIGILEEFGVLNHMVGNCNPEFVKTFIRIIEMLNGQIK